MTSACSRLPACVALLIACVGSTLSAQSMCLDLSAIEYYPALAELEGMTVADVNADTLPDLVVAGEAAATIAVMLGNASGGFAAPVSYPVPTKVETILVGNFNGDALADIACCGPASDTLYIMLADPAAGYVLAGSYATGPLPVAIASGDFDFDGDFDLVTAHHGGNAIHVYDGLGTGLFAPPTVMHAPTSATALVVADVNSDGNDDLLLGVGSGSHNQLRIYYNDGLGSFPLVEELSPAEDPQAIFVADFNGDMFPDIVTLNDSDPHLSVWLGVPVGLFQYYVSPIHQSISTLPLDDNPRRAVSGDFDLDGDVDLAWTVDRRALLVARNDGQGNFVADPGRIAMGASTRGLGAADFNGDGTLDLVVGCRGYNYDFVGMVRNNPAVGFEGPFAYQTAEEATRLLTTDVDGDGSSELVVSGLSVHSWNAAAGTLDVSVAQISPVATAPVESIISGDIDGDGDVDFLIADGAHTGTTGTVVSSLGNGTGGITFQPGSSLTLSVTPTDMGFAEMTGDGHIDVAWVYGGQNLGRLAGDGAGGWTQIATGSGLGGDHLLAGDFNGDGLGDFVVGEPNIRVVVQTPSGSLTLWDTTSMPGVVSGLEGGHFNQDSHLDVVAITPLAPAATWVWILLGDGLGGFSSATGYTTSTIPHHLATGDFNADGHLDVVTMSSEEGTATFLVGDGLGGLTQASTIYVGAYPHSLACGDFDNNGVDDLAVGRGSDNLLVFMNRLNLQDCNGNGQPDSCDIAEGTSVDTDGNGLPDECQSNEFERGDCNNDASLNLADAVLLLGYLFPIVGNPTLDCAVACDCNDDGGLNVADAIQLLSWLFTTPSAPLPPPVSCGIDPTPDTLGCATFDACP